MILKVFAFHDIPANIQKKKEKEKSAPVSHYQTE